jgi:hypothetical protein
MRKFILILFVISLLASLMDMKMAFAAKAVKNLNMRQPQIVSAIQRMATDVEVQSDIQAATDIADRLDKKSGKLFHLMSLSPLKKWLDHIDDDRLKQEYADDLMLHLSRMSALFRSHRKFGMFPRFREFEFQNLLIKSDYLLSLSVTQRSIESASKEKYFSERAKNILADYNSERVRLDQKNLKFEFAINN